MVTSPAGGGGVPPTLGPQVRVVSVHPDRGLLSGVQGHVTAVCDGVVPGTEAVEDTCGEVEDPVRSTRAVSVVVVGDEPLVGDGGGGRGPVTLVRAGSGDRKVSHYLGDGPG